MSFDVFLSCFQNGEPATFRRALLERAFGSIITDRSNPEQWVLEGGSTLYLDEGDEISGFSVNRPPDYDEFWQAIMETLRQTSSVFYWPGGGCVVANIEVAKHMPEDFIEGLGEPTVVTDPSEILELIENS
ncbi:MAG TPA: hypothetical protein VMC10_05490 [Stellaceae bacterium]|nr:hypothetical protein [Stellaceae bacterium]